MAEAPRSPNMHEFRIINDGRSALLIVGIMEAQNTSKPHSKRPVGRVISSGFREVDIATGETLFNWMSLQHINLSESMVVPTDPRAINDYLYVEQNRSS